MRSPSATLTKRFLVTLFYFRTAGSNLHAKILVSTKACGCKKNLKVLDFFIEIFDKVRDFLVIFGVWGGKACNILGLGT